MKLTLHAAGRAMERHGFIPTDAEVDEIRCRIAAGSLPVCRNLNQKGITYMITLRGVSMLPLVKNHHIITFLPVSAATAKGKRDFVRRGRTQGTGNHVDGREYRRPSTKRQLQIEEDA